MIDGFALVMMLSAATNINLKTSSRNIPRAYLLKE